jgi:hypothetical protein
MNRDQRRRFRRPEKGIHRSFRGLPIEDGDQQEALGQLKSWGRARIASHRRYYFTSIVPGRRYDTHEAWRIQGRFRRPDVLIALPREQKKDLGTLLSWGK